LSEGTDEGGVGVNVEVVVWLTVGVTGGVGAVVGAGAVNGGAEGAAMPEGMGTPASSTALVISACASWTSGVTAGFSVPHCSQTQTVLPSLVVTAWQLIQETLFWSKNNHRLSKNNTCSLILNAQYI
jgi:hypothetical protein